MLGQANMLVSKPHGAFYVLARMFEEDSYRFARELLDRHAIAVAPGDAFGNAGRGLVRISLGAATADIEHGVECLVDTVGRRDR